MLMARPSYILVAIAIIYNSRAEEGPMDQQLSRLSMCGYILLVVSVLAIFPFIGKTYVVTSERPVAGVIFLRL